MSIINVMNINNINEVCFQCKSPLICKIKLEDVQIFFYKKNKKKLIEKKCRLSILAFLAYIIATTAIPLSFLFFIYAFPFMNA